MCKAMGLPATLTLSLLSAAALATPASGQEQLAKLLTPEVSANDSFGQAISVSGDTALVTALFDTTSGVSGGAVFVFLREGPAWVQQQVLTASDAAASDFFGGSVSLSGDVAIISASGEDHGGLLNAGAAYIYRRTGDRWVEEQKLIASDGASQDRFGRVAIDGDVAVVGAFEEDHDGLNAAGAAYVFRRSPIGWIEEQKLTAPDATQFDFFGMSVAVESDTVLVGAPQNYGSPPHAGAAYVYRWNGSLWALEQALHSEDDDAFNFGFGESVSLADDLAMVSGPNYSPILGEVAAGYVFRRAGGTWSKDGDLLPDGASQFDWLGQTVCLSGQTALLGDLGFDGSKGWVNVFRRVGNSWQQVQTLLAGDGATGDWFGGSISLWGDTALVGASGDDDQGTEAGSAYAFVLNWDDLGSGLAGASGEPNLLGVGSLAAGQRVWLSVSDALPLASTIVIFGASQVDLPFKGGVLVPAPDRVLMGLESDAEGQVIVHGTWPPGMPSGLELIVQAWVVDPAAPQGFAASNAVASTTP